MHIPGKYRIAPATNNTARKTSTRIGIQRCARIRSKFALRTTLRGQDWLVIGQVACVSACVIYLKDEKKNNDLHGIVNNQIETPYKEYSINIDHYYDDNCISYMFVIFVSSLAQSYLSCCFVMQKGQTLSLRNEINIPSYNYKRRV